MAKTSMIEREKKRARTRDKYAKKRAALKATIANKNLSDEERWEAQRFDRVLGKSVQTLVEALRSQT